MTKKAPEKAAAPARKEGAGKSASGKKPNALQQTLKPSAELAAIIGDGPVTRGDTVSKMWKYIKAEKLQNAKDRRQIDADDKLKKLFKKDTISMFEMSKILAQNLQ